uniref:ATP synthase CF1 subunit delta n=1 Tax=Centroceras clavulatum TaxID=159503 RepID=A0A4D6WPY4_9FLOR|nr:ATP synthase CF1 subunit delta [Centroceras clavulatum]
MSQSSLYKVANPYAEALLELSQLNNIIEQTSKDLSFISQVISESFELKSCLSNPLIDINLKKRILDQVFSGQLNEFVLNFLFVLVDRRRISLLQVIIDKYLNLVYEAEEIIVAEVFTATILTELQQNNLIQKIKLMTKGKKIKLMTNIDSSLIGGFIIKIGSKVIDTSLSGKLKQIAFYLETN